MVSALAGKRRSISSFIFLLALLLSIFSNGVLVLPMVVKPAAAQTEILVRVDPSRAVAVNNLSLGFMLDFEWKDYIDSSARRGLARDAGFKLIRVFDWRSSSPRPCAYWNESSRTGTCDWRDVDALVGRILETGAEPMFCLGASVSDEPQIPPGMAVNPDTNLPYPQSFAAYASEWVNHFKVKGYPVRFYEIWNEPWTYFGWEPVQFTKLANYMQLFNATATSMREQNPNVSISFDFIARKAVLDYWLANGGADVDYLDLHKYDSWSVGQYTDAEMLGRAESEYFGTWPLGYSVVEARQVWLNARGKLLPVISSESNFNGAWEGGTDPRIQQMVGAVWTSLVLRMGILNGLSYYTYYSLSSSASWGKTTSTGGAGFGMINYDSNQPWYPYYVQYMLGRSLAPGDPLVGIASSSEDIRALAWIHNGELKILLTCKVDEPRTVYLQGVTGQASSTKIDNTIPWTTPSVQNAAVDASAPLMMSGYTVVLLTMNPSAMNPLDFSLSSSGGISATQGSPGSGTINVTLLNGATQPVALACGAGLPSGVSCSFSPQSGNPSFTSTVTISTSPSTPAGSYNVTLSGTSGGVSRTTSLMLTVNPQPTVTAGKITSVKVSPNPVSPSKTAGFTVTVKNTGSVAVQNAIITIALYGPDGKLATTLSAGASILTPGASGSYKMSWQVPSPTMRGTYMYRVTLNFGTVLLDSQTGTLVVK